MVHQNRRSFLAHIWIISNSELITFISYNKVAMKILIELPTWLGDSVMSTPAIENIVNSYIDPQITLIGSTITVEALKNHPKVVKTKVLKKEYISIYKTAKNLGKFDAFFSFRSSFRSNFLKFFVESKNKYQFNKNIYKNRHQVEKYNDFIIFSIRFRHISKSYRKYSENDDFRKL